MDSVDRKGGGDAVEDGLVILENGNAAVGLRESELVRTLARLQRTVSSPSMASDAYPAR